MLNTQPIVRRRDTANEAGVTLIELLVVILIIGLLAAFVAPNVFRALGGAKDTAAKSNLANYENQIAQFRLENDRVPTTEEGLEILEEQDFIRKLQADPWGNPFQYEALGASSYRLYSFGADGQPGGEDDNADIFADGSEPL